MTSNPSETTVAEALAHAKKLMRMRPSTAARQARAIIDVEPGLAEPYLILSYALRHLGKKDEADLAEKEGIRRAVEDPVAERARWLMRQDRDAQAEKLLELAIRDTPNDPEVLRLLGSIAARGGRPGHAEYSFRRSLRAAPSFEAARKDLEKLVATHGSLFEGVHKESGEDQFALALKVNEEKLAISPNDPWVWLSYGHLLRVAGRTDDAVTAYRKAVALSPDFGDAWWAIADLKSKPFSMADREAMEQTLDRPLPDKPRAAIHFALGKAYQDAGETARSFSHYNVGNQLRESDSPFDPDRLDDIIDRTIRTFTPEFVNNRAGKGAAEADPIFIISLPRSGSTLLEQMLASHSQIEATDELLELQQIANGLAGSLEVGEEIPDYIDQLAALAPEKLRSLGMSYLVNTSTDRNQGKRYFVDKAPQNWLHAGLIHLILPNAKMVHIRRDPMACGFSNFVQNYAFGRGFSYDLVKFGRYYRSYVRLMDHLDSVLPGRMHHLRYECLVRDTENELRGVFDYLGLPFEEAALRHHESDRAVKTSSSEQVRQPVNERGLSTWKSYEPWLKPLVKELGEIAHP